MSWLHKKKGQGGVERKTKKIAVAKKAPDYRYGYNDDRQNDRPFTWRLVPLLLAILFLVSAWYLLDQKILFGSNWMSQTYDNIDWRTNEGNLQTYGAWDLEAHVWKSEFIMEHWPNVLWNPYWYLGMPLFKYYQVGFYAVHIAVIKIFHLHPAYAANMIIIFGHLAATLATFLLCLRISRRYFVSALCAFFVLANTFISLRSYGWEPITVVFLTLYPLGLLVFLHQPLKPFRFWMVIALTASYFMHPLIWFSLCMTFGIYLLSLAISASHRNDDSIREHHILTQYIALVLCSLLLGGLQSVPQFSYSQVTSGAHMGVKYLPFYHVPNNVITVKDFFFDYSNLKGPGPIVMLAFLFLIVFTALQLYKRYGEMKDRRKQNRTKRTATTERSELTTENADHLDRTNDNNKKDNRPTLYQNALVRGFALTIIIMILFYYLEAYNIFPMNILRSIQYHRIIPEFIIASAALIAAISLFITTKQRKVFYYGTLISFVIGGFIIIYGVQAHWQTIPEINDKPEFINETIPGRISMTYTEQSLSVRSGFTAHPQTYGYYEQGITNPYTDEIFSVSSGFHNSELTTLYLRAADVSRLYVNREAGERNRIVQERFNGTLPYNDQNERYAYYNLPIANPAFAQAVPEKEADYVASLRPGCRIMFSDRYCGSVGEEFVGKDAAEQKYLTAYVNMLENPYNATAAFTMVDPDHYTIEVINASNDTAIVIKMTKDASWRATVLSDNEDGSIREKSAEQKLDIEEMGPYFMIVHPQKSGDYTIKLTYMLNKEYYIGGALSIITLIVLCVYFIIKPDLNFDFPEGDLGSEAAPDKTKKKEQKTEQKGGTQ